jgi:Na+/H+ antiporter
MSDAELLIGLLVVIAVLAGMARLIGVPYPVLLVLGGLAIALVPGAPQVRLDPDLILLIFLPPLVYSAAFLLSPRELRAHAQPIALLAVGLVLATMVIVAVVAHSALGIAWAPAFVLGAIVGPTDPLAATAVLTRLGAPRRITTILEGEALVNDGTALVAYKIALGAVGVAGFSIPGAAGRFIVVSIGGAIVGLLIGWLSASVRATFDEPEIEITLSLLTPYVAYIPAEQLGLSGILAVVAAGVYVGHQSGRIFSARTRLRYYPFWEVLSFLLNSVLFLLIGLELPAVVNGLSAFTASRLIADAALMSALVLGVRFAWMFLIAAAADRHVTTPVARSLPERVVFAWCGMRGAISLAAALAIPLTVDRAPFPNRDLLIFLAYAVIVVTLVAPGLTLPRLLRRLGLQDEGESVDAHGARARAHLARAALARLDALSELDHIPPPHIRQARARYETRLEHSTASADTHAVSAVPDVYRQVLREMIAAERAALTDLHRRAEIPDHVIRVIEHELDLEEARLG